VGVPTSGIPVCRQAGLRADDPADRIGPLADGAIHGVRLRVGCVHGHDHLEAAGIGVLRRVAIQHALEDPVVAERGDDDAKGRVAH
jgi:hypothetical protein